ncbi:hypothetical protein RA27_11695 [Ruegeria sp. ANG-R]|nr:hypothetical protein RA27_11695 [Ruegeria sp. ANG-R]
MLNRLNSFKTDETGAVAADWVVLTAVITGLSATVYFFLSQSLQDAGQPIVNVEVEEIEFD